MLLGMVAFGLRTLPAQGRRDFVEPLIMRDEWLATLVPFAVVLLLLLVLLRRRVSAPVTLSTLPLLESIHKHRAGRAAPVGDAEPAMPARRRTAPQLPVGHRLRCALWIYAPIHLALMVPIAIHNSDPSWRGLAFVTVTVISLPALGGIVVAYTLLHALPYRGLAASTSYGALIAIVMIRLARAIGLTLPTTPVIVVGAIAGLFAALLARALLARALLDPRS